ncbi:MAG: 3-deoxy-D-manno-octulosonic acid transferase [Bdellovibrionota bacterium]
MLSIYQFLLPFLLRVLRFFSRFSAGLREFLAGREGLIARWRQADLGENRIWFHVSSVGELEQARPVIEALSRSGKYSVVLTYFSPSVPRLVKDWSFVRHADYLPLDIPEEMHELMGIIRPRLLVLNRYDIWPNHVLAAEKIGVPILLINASTPPLGWFGWLSLHARHSLFSAVRAWTFVDAIAANAWEPFVNSRARGLVAGDPRVDRALARVDKALSENRSAEKLQLWQRQKLCLVAGSTWPKDEALLINAWLKLKFPRSLVIVPHEPTAEHLAHLEKNLARHGFTHMRFSQINAPTKVDVLLVDQRGFLAEIYGLGRLAYVGGGFGRQIHSIVEPAAHGLPVAFGPHFRRSPEAATLTAVGAALALPEGGGARILADWILENQADGRSRQRAIESLRVFLQVHRGAGERVARFVEDCLPKL